MRALRASANYLPEVPLSVEPVIPWESPEWDAYVNQHPGGSVYHTSSWIRLVAFAGGYTPRCFVTRTDGAITGALPAMQVRSRLTGSRLVSLPFSDECYAIGDSRDDLALLAGAANETVAAENLEYFEMRGTPRVVSGGSAAIVPANELDNAFARSEHFDTFHLSLTEDTDAVYRSLHKKSVRPTIKRSFKLGVTVRTSREPGDVALFYRLYCLTRRKHGIPPQPLSMFETMMSSLTDQPEALLYIAEHEDTPVGASIVLRYRGVTTLKYEVTDERFLELRPVYAMLWRSIEDAARAGFHTYDFGRTEKDNEGLAGFKKRWGTERVDLPYFYSPPAEGLSTVDQDSLKYRVFTTVFSRLPIRLSALIGSRLFRHFG